MKHEEMLYPFLQIAYYSWDGMGKNAFKEVKWEDTDGQISPIFNWRIEQTILGESMLGIMQSTSWV